MQWNLAAIGASVLPNVGGWINGAFMGNEIKGWYQTLKRPSWTPPDWVFGPVWTGLYTGMGYASYLVWRDAGRTFGGAATLPLALYGTQLALNWAWSPIFFKAHNLKLALIDILLTAGCAAVCGIEFYKVNEIAGYLFIPYISWMTLATAITYRVYKDNPKQIKAKKSE